jgi:small subunit ribosomal protein S6
MQDRTYTYEGLFLFPQSAVADLQGAADHVLELLNRAGAEIISFKKWDERRLAYEVEGNKRGLYFLVYFKAQGSRLAGLERDTNLSEKMLRSLITRADHVLPEIMQAAEGRQQLADEIKLRATQPAAVLAAQETAPAAPEPDIDEEEDFVVAVDEV